jgi:hypothetical protein
MQKLVIILILGAALSACSFRIETGYHGLTGRDDRTQTQLITERDAKRIKY